MLNDVELALRRINPFINPTPIISSKKLDEMLGHEFLFKLESLQISGSFKARGILSAITKLQEVGNLPVKIVTYGTGNHGTALAYISKKFFDISVEVFLPNFALKTKIDKIESYGGKVTITSSRDEAEKLALNEGSKDGCILIPPADNDDIILGCATIAYEVLNQTEGIDSIFVPIGGGGLSSGTLIARDLLSPHTKVFASEPKQANDASISYQNGTIFRFKQSPYTIADGATTLGVTSRVFNHIKKLDGIYEITEEEIKYWTVWSKEFIGFDSEPTSALALAAAVKYAKNISDKRKILIIITGSNIDTTVYNNLFKENYLSILPKNF